MMLDLEQSFCPLQLESDICIVGAGPAGITIAQQLIASGIRVCLTEGGGWTEEAATHALYDGTSVGHHVDLTEGRYRIFGGSATKWAGRCALLDDIDFQERSWVSHSGWPMGLADLLPYYERAKIIANFREPWLDDDSGIASIKRTAPDFGSEEVIPFVWRAASRDLPISWRSYLSLGYKSKFDWGRSYRQAIIDDNNTFLILHANLISMAAHNSDTVRAAAFKSLNGNNLTVRAKAFVICCGGIENARIALNLPEDLLGKINSHGNVGRYFAQHPRGKLLSLKISKAQGLTLQRTFNNFSRPPRYPVQYELGFALSEIAQREHRILNASAAIFYSVSPNSSWAAGRRLREALRARKFAPSIFSDLLVVAGDLGISLKQAFKKYVSAFELIFPDCVAEVYIDLEQQPDPESRIRLGGDADELGVRRTEINWRIGELERKTARVFAEKLAGILRHLGLADSEAADWLHGSDPIRASDLQGNYHFIGTTRMAKIPANGVVDENCRAFGVKNLFFAGASVFPTGGHANPTLTIIALSIRLSDHLRSQLLSKLIL